MKFELTYLKVKEMELENEAAAAETVRSPDESESKTSKTLSRRLGTSGITIFIDVDKSESGTLSCRS